PEERFHHHQSATSVRRRSCSDNSHRRLVSHRKVDHHGGALVAYPGTKVATQSLYGGVGQKQPHTQTIAGIHHVFARRTGKGTFQTIAVVFDDNLHPCIV